MKNRINLLKTNKRFIGIEHLLNNLKIVTVFIFIIFLIVYSAFFYFLLQQNRKIEEHLTQKKIFLDFFIKNKDVEAKFAYFRNKQEQLTNILQEDVNFYPYYNLLQESLEITNIDARLDSVLIDMSKSVSFSIIFTNYPDLLNFLRFAESEDFLKNFNQLSLINFSKNDLATSKKDYRLNFSGKFININEN